MAEILQNNVSMPNFHEVFISLMDKASDGQCFLAVGNPTKRPEQAISFAFSSLITLRR